MSELRYTLVSEGSTDKRLLPILTWLVQQHSLSAITATWADLSVAASPPRTLEERVLSAVSYYPCDVLFVHRDADNQSRAARVAEIRAAVTRVRPLPCIPVVPVRMQETWLLLNEAAIRLAAGNPTGRMPLGLPPRATVENHADAKRTLRVALQTASGLSGRHLARFNVSRAAYRLSELVDDYAYLRGLPSFDLLETDIESVLTSFGLDL